MIQNIPPEAKIGFEIDIKPNKRHLFFTALIVLITMGICLVLGIMMSRDSQKFNGVLQTVATVFPAALLSPFMMWKVFNTRLHVLADEQNIYYTQGKSETKTIPFASIQRAYTRHPPRGITFLVLETTSGVINIGSITVSKKQLLEIQELIVRKNPAVSTESTEGEINLFSSDTWRVDKIEGTFKKLRRFIFLAFVTSSAMLGLIALIMIFRD